MSSRGLWSFPTDHTVDCFTALKVCEKSLPLSISIMFFLLHKIFPADLKQHLGSSDENCWFTQLCIGYSRQCHSRSITIIHRETLNRTLNSNVVLGCKLSFTSNHVTYIIVHCAGNSADKDLKYASSGPIFQIVDEHLSLKLPGDIHVSSQALKHNANAIQCCQKLFCGCGAFFFFLNVVTAEGKVLWAGIQLAHITRYVIYFATAATEKHDITPSLSSAVQSVWPLSAAVVGRESAGKLLQGAGHRW